MKAKNYDNDSRLAVLERSEETINSTLIRLETKMDTAFSRFDTTLNRLDSKFDNLQNQMMVNFRWTILLIVSLFIINSGMADRLKSIFPIMPEVTSHAKI